MKRELNKQEKKESKHALDVQHGSHPPDCMPNIEASICANYSLIFQGQQIEMTITLKPSIRLEQSIYRWKDFFE
jgi:glutamate mutase epsilon subunit